MKKSGTGFLRVGFVQRRRGRYHRAPLRPPIEIVAPPFPRGLSWFNTAPLRIDQQRHRPVLVEFWEMTMPNSMRTIPYLAEWHRRYSPDGLRVIAAHTPASQLTSADETVEAAVSRLGLEYPVINDNEGELWSMYGAHGYPMRFLWDGDFRLFDMQVGEGAYLETELMIQQLLGIEREPMAAVRPEDESGAARVVPTEAVSGAFEGDYHAGGVWISVAGSGSVIVDGDQTPVDGPAAIELRSHEVHTSGSISIEAGEGVEILSTVFTPGISPD